MELIFQLTLLLLGLILLWKTGDMAVRYALGFSTIFGIQQFTVGFLIFSISTGLAEISSALISSLSEVPELSVGDLIGSAFVNVSLILGIIAIMAKQMEMTPELKRTLLRSIGLIFLILIWFLIIKVGSFWNGLILIGIYVGAILWFRAGLPKKEAREEIKTIEKEVESKEQRALLSPKIDVLLKLFGSLGLLLIASWITVHSAVKLSKLTGINLTLLGGTILAVGTSLPELFLEIHSIRRKEYALALGNLFGASLLNVSFTLGALMLLNPDLDLTFVKRVLPFISAVFLWVLQSFIRNGKITRRDGFVYLGIFVCYIGWTTYLNFG